MIFTNFREIDGAGRIVISKDIRNHLISKRAICCILRQIMIALQLKKRKKNAFSAIRPKI